jgi:hypothetical protein
VEAVGYQGAVGWIAELTSEQPHFEKWPQPKHLSRFARRVFGSARLSIGCRKHGVGKVCWVLPNAPFERPNRIVVPFLEIIGHAEVRQGPSAHARIEAQCGFQGANGVVRLARIQ